MLFSQSVFDWLLTTFLVVAGTGWVIYDGRLLVRLLADREKRGDLAHRDRIFGSIIGLALAAIGILGVLNFHLWHLG